MGTNHDVQEATLVQSRRARCGKQEIKHRREHEQSSSFIQAI